ncbi:MAG TPA: pyridoxal-phosphate dependent enzyme [Gaiellaceae bacterium]|nr:pyridoxal-phosphate dependent enzyme [Gaiellaceae bacterium]
MTELPTPLEQAPASLAGDRRLLLKREDVHELGAFKWRGALPVLERYREEGAPAVVTASTGNHGAATAWAAERLGLRAVVYAPEAASQAKLELIGGLAAELRLAGADLDEAKVEARRWADEQGLPFFEDGAEPEQYQGYGAIADEILDQVDETPAAVIVPVGNGALLGGIGLRVCDLSPDTQRIGVAAKEAPVMAQSWEAGHVVESTRCSTFADGLAVRVAIPLAVDVLGEVASRMLLVSEREIAGALAAYAEAGMRAEGAAAAALAALPQLEDVEGTRVLLVTGRNIDDGLFTRARDHPETFRD